MQKKIHHYPQRASRYNSPYRGIIKTRDTDLGGGSLTSHPRKVLCPNCRRADKMSVVGNTDVCRICGGKTFMIAPRVRVPRKLASNHTWEIFLKRFCRKALE
jgi:hypothetical protein